MATTTDSLTAKPARALKYAAIGLVGMLLALLAFDAAGDVNVTYLDAPRPFRGAQVYKEKESGVVFYVESDSRHVAAIDPRGKLLWNRDPFVDAKLKPYRNQHPVIVLIGPPVEWMLKGPWIEKSKATRFVRINFDSSQFGILNAETGDFIFLGQD